QPDISAARLPFPHPLSLRPPALHIRGSTVYRGRERPLGCLPPIRHAIEKIEKRGSAGVHASRLKFASERLGAEPQTPLVGKQFAARDMVGLHSHIVHSYPPAKPRTEGSHRVVSWLDSSTTGGTGQS